MRIVGPAVALPVLAHVLGVPINRVLARRERGSVHPYGRLVEVDGRRMHVFALGNGEPTVVLLAGANVPLPSADFGPLMRLLSPRFTVVCVEEPGVGHSDPTPVPRTNEHVVREIRLALTRAGFRPPYVLMPHSASGITSEYFATQHPGEVAAIVMLDTTSSAVADTRVPAVVYRLSRALQATGVSRFVNRLVVPRLLRENRGFTAQETRDFRVFMNQLWNDTIIDRNLRFADNVDEVMRLPFPGTIPVRKIVPRSTLKRVGEPYQREHLRRLGPNARLEFVEGSHFVHHTHAARILDATVELLERS